MKEKVVNILNILVYGNFWIALCAVAQGLLTFKLIGMDYSVPVLIILFLATFFIYNIKVVLAHVWLDKKRWQGMLVGIRSSGSFDRMMLGLALLSLLAILPFALELKFNTVLLFALTAFLALAYSLPVLPDGKGGLRQVPVIKTLLIAVVWSLSTVVVPIVESGVGIEPSHFFILLIKRFILVFTLALLFDIRDQQVDKEKNLQTIATYLGTDKSRYLGFFLLLLDLVLMYVYDYRTDQNMFLALLLFMVITSLVVWFATPQRKKMYYLLLVDGMLMLQYVLVSTYME